MRQWDIHSSCISSTLGYVSRFGFLSLCCYTNNTDHFQVFFVEILIIDILCFATCRRNVEDSAMGDIHVAAQYAAIRRYRDSSTDTGGSNTAGYGIQQHALL